MNVIYMAKQTESSVPSLYYLIAQGVNVLFAVIREQDDELRDICEKHGVNYGNEKECLEYIINNNYRIEWLLSYYWKKIDRIFLELPENGCINFHPGPLPEARGSGYHISIIENWGYWGVTAHYMDECLDTGRIIECEKFTVPSNIINRDLVRESHRRLVALFKRIIKRILDGEIPESYEQPTGAFFSLKDIEDAKYISEHDTPEQINRKIRAFWNPPYTGAKIVLHGAEYTVINQEILDYIEDNMSKK